MTIKTAYAITRNFKTSLFSFPPIFFEKDNLVFRVYKNTVQIVSPSFNVTYKNITKKQFLKQKDLFDISFVYSYDDYNEYLINEDIYLTSIGIVSRDDYFLAKDIMEGLNTIPKKELKEDIVYLSDKGNKYYYLKDEYYSLYDIKLEKEVLKNSVRIVDEFIS